MMRFIRISTLVAIAAGVLPCVAAAGEQPPTAGAQNGIIAVLIGQVRAQPFTPPIGTDKGSVVPGARG